MRFVIVVSVEFEYNVSIIDFTIIITVIKFSPKHLSNRVSFIASFHLCICLPMFLRVAVVYFQFNNWLEFAKARSFLLNCEVCT